MTKRLALLLLLAGCPLRENDPCQPNGSMFCASNTSSFWCENGTAHESPCPGPLGCTMTTDGTSGFCDAHNVSNGTKCPTAREDQWVCNSATEAAVCTRGRWQTQRCSLCSEVAGQVSCRP